MGHVVRGRAALVLFTGLMALAPVLAQEQAAPCALVWVERNGQLAWEARTNVGVFLRRRGRIAAMTGRTSQSQSIFAIVEFVERSRRTELMHWLDLVVTLKTTFERCGRRRRLLRAS